MRMTLFALAALFGIALGVASVVPAHAGQQTAWTDHSGGNVGEG